MPDTLPISVVSSLFVPFCPGGLWKRTISASEEDPEFKLPMI
jgi:hypothetical protein